MGLVAPAGAVCASAGWISDAAAAAPATSPAPWMMLRRSIPSRLVPSRMIPSLMILSAMEVLLVSRTGWIDGGRRQTRPWRCGDAREDVDGYWMPVTSVHAQSSRQIERCAELGR